MSRYPVLQSTNNTCDVLVVSVGYAGTKYYYLGAGGGFFVRDMARRR